MTTVLYLATCQARYQKSCYQVVTDTKTWADAATNCQNLGGHLAAIETRAENDVIHQLLQGEFFYQFRNVHEIARVCKI